MHIAHYLIAGAALGGAFLMDISVARAHHCGGTDTSDFSYMGTTCRYQRSTGAWQYNHDMVITDDYDPFLIVQRTADVNNCGSAASTQATLDATTTDTDTASYSVGVALAQSVKAAIGSDMAATLGISVQAGFTAGTQMSSTVSGQIGGVVSASVPGCSRTRITARVIGFHDATVQGSVSQKHWYRIHCDNPQYTTSWNVCATSTQTVTGSSATACVSRAYLESYTTDLGCAPGELSQQCACDAGPSCTDAGTDASWPDASPHTDASWPDASPNTDASWPDAGFSDSGICVDCDAGVMDASWNDSGSY
jgi:hypothetical protein